MKRGAEKRRQRPPRASAIVRDSEKLIRDAAFAIVADLAYADARLLVAFGWGENITDRCCGGRAQIQISPLPELRR